MREGGREGDMERHRKREGEGGERVEEEEDLRRESSRGK